MGKGMKKAERLIELERILLQHQQGVAVAELAGRLGVDRTTAWRDVRELENNGVPLIELEHGRYTIDRMHYLASVRLSPAESVMLYLAARRLSRHTRLARPVVTSALEKLALALRQPMTQRLEAAARRILTHEASDPERDQVMETLVRAWAEGLRVRIRHRKLQGQARTYVVSPYLIEPSIWGEGAYLIGHSDYHDGLATFKIERIEHAMLTTERFAPPDDFDEDELLRHAWGIWYDEGEPTRVRLRFSAWVADRVRESVWHPTQTITLLPDGGCLWEAEVAEVREMVPWIRGWGADCEALAPQDLRDELIGEARRLAEKYGWSVHRNSAETASDDDPLRLNQTFADFFGDD